MIGMLRRLATASLVIVLVVPAGCSSGFQYAEVEGTVTMAGKPINNVRIEFWPVSDGPKSTGITDAQGKYTLKSEDGKSIGAVVGTHKVLFKDMDMYGTQFLGRKAENMKDLSGGKKARFGPHYADPNRAVSQAVTSGQKNVIDLEIK